MKCFLATKNAHSMIALDTLRLAGVVLFQVTFPILLKISLGIYLAHFLDNRRGRVLDSAALGETSDTRLS